MNDRGKDKDLMQDSSSGRNTNMENRSKTQISVQEQGAEASLDSQQEKRHSEIVGLYATRFWTDWITESDIVPGDRNARDLLEALPLWRKWMKKKSSPNVAYHPEVVDTIDLQTVTDVARENSLPENIVHLGDQTHLENQMAYWRIRHDIGERALEIQSQVPQPAK